MDPADRDKNDQFLRLFVENEEALRGFVRSLVPTLEDAREVMQETAAVLWRKFEEVDSPGDFRRWATYGLLGYRFDFGLMPFVMVERMTYAAIDPVSEVNVTGGGLNHRFSPRLVLILAYIYASLIGGDAVGVWIVNNDISR